MNIGQISQNANGHFTGQIATLAIDMAIHLVPVNSDKERAPKYEICARSPSGARVQVGAFWEQSAKATGEVFLQGRLEDPSIPKPLQISAFEQQDGSYNLVWQEQRRPRNAFVANDRQERSMPAAA
jgi:uncharacterized protein (DUF736 family)